MNLIIDTHAHINFKDYKDDSDEVLKRSLKNGVWLINVGAEWDTSKRAVEYSEKYPEGVFSAVGLHPFHVKDQEFVYEKYKELVLKEKTVAVGEIGLDYYHLKDIKGEPEQIKNLQKQLFLKQLDLAEELQKPLIIHCREAHEDLLEILNSYFLIHNSKFGGVVHSFSGNYKQAREYRQLGFKIAFNGIITFARDYDKVILDTPLEDILLETDCPYLAPVPYRGQRNEPLYVVEVAKKIAEIKNLTTEEVTKRTTLNAKEVFRLD